MIHALTLEMCLNADRDSWEIGTCIPSSILGRNGYLPRYHPNINFISLVTDSLCDHADGQDSMTRISLDGFEQLEALSWIGIGIGTDDFLAWEWKTLHDCIIRNSRHLKSPLVKAGHWSAVNYDKLYDFFASHVNVSEPVFPALQTLVLASFRIEGGSPITYSCFSALKRLQLQHYEGTIDFLEGLMKCCALKLEFLELTGFLYDSDSEPNLPHVTINKFLRSFSGLKALSLCLGIPMWNFDLGSIVGHKTTLEQITIEKWNYWLRGGCRVEIGWPLKLPELFNVELVGLGNPPDFIVCRRHRLCP